jgi:hypothetical protein
MEEITAQQAQELTQAEVVVEQEEQEVIHQK